MNVRAADTTPPTIQSLSSSPNPINAGGTEVIRAHVTDSDSGVRYVWIDYKPSNGSGLSTNMALVSGTSQDGIWQLSISISTFAPSGTWTIESVSAEDVANNDVYIDAPNPLLNGAAFSVIGGPNADATPPVIQSLSSSPNPVNAGAITTIRAHVTDSGGGVRYVWIDYKPSNGSGLSTNMTFVSGSLQDGIWQLSLSIPISAPPGKWTIESISAEDMASNDVYIDAPSPLLDGAAFNVVGPIQAIPPPRVGSSEPQPGPSPPEPNPPSRSQPGSSGPPSGGPPPGQSGPQPPDPMPAPRSQPAPRAAFEPDPIPPPR
jgi:serine protease